MSTYEGMALGEIPCNVCDSLAVYSVKRDAVRFVCDAHLLEFNVEGAEVKLLA